VARPDRDFPADPYPGAVPPGSFVHVDGESHALEPGPWRVDGRPLDAWLVERGAPPAAGRVPVLAYGSNRCPSKITWLRRELGLGDDPVVVLGAEVRGLAAVWAAGLRVRDGQRPAVLAAWPGAVERHAVWLATPGQIAVLDRCEGRDDRFRLARVRTGEVRTDDGARIDGPWSYVGHGAVRRPLLVDGAPVRCADVPQDRAVALEGSARDDSAGDDGLDAPTVHGPPHPDEWPPRLFAYGLLEPGGVSWGCVAPHATGAHRPAEVRGDVLDTGRGYPAWLPDGRARTPGTLVELRDPVTAFPAMDAYEGPEYERIRTVLDDGTVAWAYAWRAPTTGFRPGWTAVSRSPRG
jgi:gamma-glutamylcyclotransferase (GGCT)/AIG2-like uncharacterized protein YtfP